MKISDLPFPRLWRSILTIGFPITHILKVGNNIFYFNSILTAIIIIVSLTSCSSSSKFERYENIDGRFIETGEASWYGPGFHGKLTANGEIFNTNDHTAAHKTLPFNSIVRVTNRDNGKSVIVRINDRGPYARDRIIDLSRKAAEEIDLINNGTARVNLYMLSGATLPDNIKKESFTVQVGSFNNYRDADKYARNFSKYDIVEAIINGKRYFRVYSGVFNSKDEADKHLKSLQNNGYEGFVKQIEN